MPNFPDINKIHGLIEDLEKINLISNDLISQFYLYLGVKPLIDKIDFIIVEEDSTNLNFINLGISVENYDDNNNSVLIKIYKNFTKFLPFIVIREVLRCFINEDFRNNNSLNLIINQITITFLSNHNLVKEWRSVILESIPQKKLELINEFNRLEYLYSNINLINDPNPTQFFFQYLHKHKNLINQDVKSFSFIFFKDFKESFSESTFNNELVETLRIIIIIFLRVKKHHDYLQYKNFFLEFKTKKIIETDLSLRKFTQNMDWIKNHSYITLSYQINWPALNIAVIILYIEFNPLLNKLKLLKILKDVPFFISPKISVISNSVDISGYVVIPKIYLDDFINFLNSLKENNYISSFKVLLRLSQDHCVNLNYFKEEFGNRGLINYKHYKYQKKNEIVIHLEWNEKYKNQDLSLLEFLILNRVRMFLFSGLGFERRVDNLKIIKSDIFNEIIKQKTFINKLKENLKNIYKSDSLKIFVLQKLYQDQDLGFFYAKKKIHNYLDLINKLEPLIEENRIENINDLQKFLSRNIISSLIEDNLVIAKTNIQDYVIKEFFSVYFDSKREFYQKVANYKIYNELLELSSFLKIFSLNNIIKIVNDEKLINILFQNKDKKLNEIYEQYQVQDLNSEMLDKILAGFIDSTPPVLTPLLINTIITKKFEKDYFQLVLSDSVDIPKKLQNLRNSFPRTLINYNQNLISSENLYSIEISMPSLDIKEKHLFISIIYNIFKNSIIYIKNYLWSGFILEFLLRDFYDFEEKKFFYTKDLYKGYLKFVYNHFKNKLGVSRTKKFKNQKILWTCEDNFFELVKIVGNRIARENNVYDSFILEQLKFLFLNIESLICITEEFKEKKIEIFFQNHIKAIKFIPVFKRFNLSRFITYFYSSDLNQINFKSLLGTNFLKIEYPACIDDSIPFLVDHIISSNQFNNSILDNVLAPENKIREYCGFVVKKTHILFHFEMNFTPEGWDYDSVIFKEHLENVLFNKEYQFKIPNLKSFQFSDNDELPQYDLNSPEFQDLCEIYNYHSIDIKSYIGTKKIKTVERIQTLLKKGLIFPYIILKNLGFQESLYLIIPDLNQDSVNTLIKIFGWFNYGFIHEIEGKYFIYGFDEPVEFTHGLMMKIYFPKCELSEFKQLFDKVFEYLQVKHYLILKDFVNGETLVKNIHEDPDFFKTHHPLRNIINDHKDV